MNDQFKIHFLNVGHGDCIVMEWADNDKVEIGIIDCNDIPLSRNPVIAFLSAIEVSCVRFIIMSHPHLDHFGGLLDVVNYCVSNHIPIRRFYHTSLLSKAFLYYSVFGNSDRTRLMKLLATIEDLTRNPQSDFEGGLLNRDTKDISLNAQITISFLAPGYQQFTSYNSKANSIRDFGELRKQISNNPEANILSTALLVSGQGWHILLTSDCEAEVLKMIQLEDLSTLGGKFICIQVPHHGSKNNHVGELYQYLNIGERTSAVISFGSNRYGHPATDVVQELCQWNYSVYGTNQSLLCKSMRKADVQNSNEAIDVVLELIDLWDDQEDEIIIESEGISVVVNVDNDFRIVRYDPQGVSWP